MRRLLRKLILVFDNSSNCFTPFRAENGEQKTEDEERKIRFPTSDVPSCHFAVLLYTQLFDLSSLVNPTVHLLSHY